MMGQQFSARLGLKANLFIYIGIIPTKYLNDVTVKFSPMPRSISGTFGIKMLLSVWDCGFQLSGWNIAIQYFSSSYGLPMLPKGKTGPQLIISQKIAISENPSPSPGIQIWGQIRNTPWVRNWSRPWPKIGILRTLIVLLFFSKSTFRGQNARHRHSMPYFRFRLRT